MYGGGPRRAGRRRPGCTQKRSLSEMLTLRVPPAEAMAPKVAGLSMLVAGFGLLCVQFRRILEKSNLPR